MQKQENGFSMPMFKQWVPRSVRPWIYLALALVFQLTGSYYMGALGQIVGTTGLMREDVTIIAMMGVVGINMPFPFLFRFKFRFTNRQLLITAASVIAICNVLMIWVTWMPMLCLISYVAGFMKLCGTFECFSNLRLWISPKQDFGVFLPTIYIVILGAHSLSMWLTQQVTYSLQQWQMVNWMMIGVLLAVIVLLLAMTRSVRLMPRMPLVSLDWLGCLLWSSVMLEVIWLFTYGEYYNWSDSPLWRAVAFALPVTLLVCIGRMRHIRHPYIAPELWTKSRLWSILAMFAVAEMMNASPHVLQGTLTAGVLHWGTMTVSELELWEVAGSALGCLLVVWWSTQVRRSYTGVLSLGFVGLLAYTVIMYFSVSPDLPLSHLRLPTMLRTMGYAVFFSAMTLYLNQLYGFQTFFMSLTVSGFIRNGVVQSVFSGIYSYSLRYRIADNLARGVPYDMSDVVLMSIKQGYGVLCQTGVVILLLMLIYEFQPVRTRLKRMPSYLAVHRLITGQLRE